MRIIRGLIFFPMKNKKCFYFPILYIRPSYSRSHLKKKAEYRDSIEKELLNIFYFS